MQSCALQMIYYIFFFPPINPYSNPGLGGRPCDHPHFVDEDMSLSSKNTQPDPD